MQREAVRYAITNGRLFVYGSLMQGEEEHYKLEGETYLGPCLTAPRYHLVQLMALGEDFYGLEHGGHDAIEGELYQVTLDKLIELDNWEDSYQREYVMLNDGKIADAYFPVVLRHAVPAMRAAR